MENNRNCSRAEITVFLSLISLVLLALLGTMVEVTRGKVCQVHGRRTLKAASYSLLTEYSRPLYEEYRLFFLEDAGTPFETSIAEYAADILEPESVSGKRTDFYAGTLTAVKVGQKQYVGDEGCEAMKRQICSYMKGQLATDALETFCRKTEPVGDLGKKAGNLEQKAAEEKEAAQSGKKLLELMKLIDGVSYSGGKIWGQDYFVKMFCVGEKKSERLGITEVSVWNAIKGKVIRVDRELNRILKSGTARRTFLEEVREVKKRLEKAEKYLKSLGKEAEKLGISPRAERVLASNRKILSETEEILNWKIGTEDISVLKALWKNYDTTGIVFDYSGIRSEGGGENPLDSFKKVISGGLSKLVVKEEKALSKKSVNSPDHYRKLYEEKEAEEDYSESVRDFAENEEVKLQGAVKDLARITMTDFMLVQYMNRYFSTVKYSVGEAKKRLEYEWEYIICGEKSDKDNLEQIINRIVLMRTVINSGVLFASSSKRETAYAAALAVVGFTGMEPLIRFTQTIFTLLWGMTESLVDVAALLQDKEVPLIKTEKDLVVKFEDICKISRPYLMEKVKCLPEKTKNSFGYEQYLMLFMAGNGSDVTCYRMMDLMEWNIRDNYFRGFNLGLCVDSFSVFGVFSFETKFFRLPFVENILERKLQQFNREMQVNMGYSAQ